MKNVSALLMLTALLLTGIMGCNGNGTTPAPLSSEKAITAFTLNGAVVTIDETGKTLQVKMPFGTDVTSLMPAITHTGSSISPLSGVARNFSSPVTYTVTAADGSTATYTVTVSVPSKGLLKTGQTTSFASGDDGDLERGVAWPSPRFIDNGNTITDNATGLMWTKDGNAPGPAECTTGVAMNTADALNYVACLNTNAYLGYNDWRLPNVSELESLAHRGTSNPAAWLNTQGFSSVQSAWYRSSTTTASSTSYAWVVMMGNGNVFNSGPKANADRVWPVREGPFGTISLPQSGQTTSFASGDDGDLQKGIAWPSPRFTDNGDSTITDTLTGLMWTQDANAPGPAGCTNGTAKTWQQALDHVACLNTNAYLTYSDWRLPNVRELRSLVHYGEASIYTWLNNASQGFSNVQGNWYWSSTTCWAYDPIDTYAWMVSMSDGQISNNAKTVSYTVWPVRDSQP